MKGIGTHTKSKPHYSALENHGSRGGRDVNTKINGNDTLQTLETCTMQAAVFGTMIRQYKQFGLENLTTKPTRFSTWEPFVRHLRSLSGEEFE